MTKEFKTVDSHNGYLSDMLKRFKLNDIQDRIMLAIDRAYNQGYEDGINETQNEMERENKRQGKI